MRAVSVFKLMAAYLRARRYDHLASRRDVAHAQQRWLRELQTYVVRHSPFYRPYANTAWTDWPTLDKSEWMQNFDAINTVGARLENLSNIAQEAERTRNFSLGWNGYTVGMSTGTSGNRGVFLVSPAEGAQWAGTLLGKLLRGGLLARERIALVLRAGATLYDAIGALRLRFRFFDEAQPWQALAEQVCNFNPTILVAPASALRLLSDLGGKLRPRRVVSVAEVLDNLDRQHIERNFAAPAEQIYQATEGLLGMSCERGTVHLNEPYLIVEPQWLDAQHTRFTPLVTDLWRRTQPVIRYRLNDVLQVTTEPCPCGRAAVALAAIEGRSDDVLWLDGAGGPVPVFPDLLTRAVVNVLPELSDFRIVETRRGEWRIQLLPMPAQPLQQQLHDKISAITAALAATAPKLTICELAVSPRTGKQRRVLGAKSRACAS